MSVDFTLTSKTRVDSFQDVASLGDVTKYQIDATPWEEDNEEITSAAWSVESGSVSIDNETLVDGVAAVELTFNQAGRAVISLLLTTATVKKKVWLEVAVKDQRLVMDDYGIRS